LILTAGQTNDSLAEAPADMETDENPAGVLIPGVTIEPGASAFPGCCGTGACARWVGSPLSADPEGARS